MSSQCTQVTNFLEAKPIPLISPPLSPNPCSLTREMTQSNKSNDSGNNSLEGPKLNNQEETLQQQRQQQQHNLPKITITQDVQKDSAASPSSSTSSSMPRNKYRMRICEAPP